MISATLLPDLSTVIGEADASRLRNKGYKLRKTKNGFLLDKFSSLYLIEKGRIEVFFDQHKHNFNYLWDKLSEKDKIFYIAYKGLRDLGKKPYFNGNLILLNGKRVNVKFYRDEIKFSELILGYLAIVDSDNEAIYYEIKRRNPRLLKFVEKYHDKDTASDIADNKIIVKSGSKFGCDYRVYKNNEVHSSILVNVTDVDDCKSIIARARVAHSVRKDLIYCYGYKDKHRCVSIKWIR